MHPTRKPPKPPKPHLTVLFVHGMGRTPASGWPLLWRLRRAGLATSSFGYVVTLERFDTIVARLRQRLVALAAQGPYAVVGHSLGGVLLRAALCSLPPGVAQPRQVVLLGSPVRAARLATQLKDNVLFKGVAADCGQLLASQARMAAIGVPPAPTMGIAGVKGIGGLGRSALNPFGAEPNDGVVSLSEVTAPWLAAQHRVPVVHTLLPSSARVARLVLDVLGCQGCVVRVGP